MAKIKVLNLNGETKEDITLNDTVWNTEVNEIVLSDAIRLQMASLRQGTHDTKGRSEVSGGGIVFGPTPRDYGFKMNKKERRLALRSALSDKFQNKELCVVENLELATPKTKDFKKVLETLKLEGKTLIVTDGENGNACLAARNLTNLHVIEPSSINVLDLVGADNLLIDVESVKKIEEVLK